MHTDMQSQIASIHLARELKRVATEAADKYRNSVVSQPSPHNLQVTEKIAGNGGTKYEGNFLVPIHTKPDTFLSAIFFDCG